MTVTIRRLTLLALAFLAIGLVLIAVAFTLSDRAQTRISAASSNRYLSYQLANELRTSSDDLTRLARTYVVTGDPKYEAQYWDVLAIRNGEKPLPEDYYRIYWDFMAVDGVKPRPDTEKISLRKLMEQAGFVEAEFAKLKESQDNSDGLVKLETIAMNAVKGQFDDGQGHFTVKKDPDPELARRLMHSPDYHKFKANIMRPIDDFYVLLDKRTSAAIVDAQNEAGFWRGVLILMLVLEALALAVLGTGLVRRVIGPLAALKSALAGLAAGNLAVEIAGTDRRDELGEMARAAQAFRLSLAESQELRQAREAAQQRAATERQAAMSELAVSFESSVSRSIGAVGEAVTGLSEDARNTLGIAERASGQAGAVSAAAEATTANVQTVAAAAEELSATVSEISRQIVQATTVAENAVREAASTTQSVSSLSEAATRIGDVVRLIHAIASQTNLLALNATIEAARAGEAGKGFAVVASEVKNLASQTAKATDDIQTQITAIQAETKRAVAAIAGISGTIAEINSITAAVADSVEQQGAATAEITRSVQQAAAGSRDVSKNISGVDQATAETRQAAGRMSDRIRVVERLAESLRGDVDRFLARVRA